MRTLPFRFLYSIQYILIKNELECVSIRVVHCGDFVLNNGTMFLRLSLAMYSFGSIDVFVKNVF